MTTVEQADKPLTAESCDLALEALEDLWERVPKAAQGMYRDRYVRLKRFIERVRRAVADDDLDEEAAEGSDAPEHVMDPHVEAITDAVLTLFRPLDPPERVELLDTIGDEWCSDCGEENGEGHECGAAVQGTETGGEER